jgi:ferrous iron transport protein B
MKSCCDTNPSPRKDVVKGKYTIALIGQPNCGKTTLFNRLTGTHQTTGNWPGVTVERKEGIFQLEDRQAKLVDLPGVYSLMEDRHSGTDEQVARNFLTYHSVDLVINVVDATALERQLFLTMQLLHMGLPVVVALNRTDLLKQRHLNIDIDQLAKHLGCPVVPISAYHNQGIDTLKEAVVQHLNQRCQLKLHLPQPLGQAVQDIQAQMDDQQDSCWHALQPMLNPQDAPIQLRQQAEHWRKQVETELGDELPLIIADLYFRKA